MTAALMDVDTSYLRPRKAECTRRIFEAYRDLGADPGIAELRDVVVTPMGVRPDIDDSAPGMLHDDCAYRATVGPAQSAGVAAGARHAPGRVLYGGYLRSQWGHFLMNSTARLWPLFGPHPVQADTILFFADGKNPRLSGNYLEFMQLAGLADKIMVVVDEPVRVDHLIVPAPALMHYHSYSRRMYGIFEAVRRAALTSAPQPQELPERVFLTRSQLPGASRYEINLEYIDRFFAAAGYQVVSPEKLTLTQLIVQLSGCNAVASVSGSTAHNILFAPPQAEGVTIERTAAVNPFQAAVSLIMGRASVAVDAFRLPMIAKSTGRLFLYGSTPELRRFAADRGMTPPDIADDDRGRLRELRRFQRTYGWIYGSTTGLHEWESASIEAIVEAYADSAAYYGRWLSARIYPFPYAWLSPAYWLKRLTGRL